MKYDFIITDLSDLSPAERAVMQKEIRLLQAREKYGYDPADVPKGWTEEEYVEVMNAHERPKMDHKSRFHTYNGRRLIYDGYTPEKAKNYDEN